LQSRGKFPSCCATLPGPKGSPAKERRNKTAGPVRGPAAVLVFRSVLEAFLQSDVPEPASDISQRFVVIVLERSGDKRRIFIEHVLHAERDGCAIHPGAPSALAICSRADRHHVLFFSVLHLHVLTAVLGVTRHFLNDWCRHVKRVGGEQIKSCPLPHLTIKALE